MSRRAAPRAHAPRRDGAQRQGCHMSMLRVNNLRKKYKSRTVVQDVSFEVASGEVVGLLGPNGAGKTTCFYMIVGLIAADGGEIVLDGQTLTHMPIHKRAKLGLSYLPQEVSVFRKLKVAENIEAVLELQGLSQNADPRAAGRTARRNCISPTCATTRRFRSPAASVGGSRSPARSLPARA